MGILNGILYFLSLTTPIPPKIHICERDLGHLTYEKRLRMGVGCSSVDGKRIYNDYILERIYNE